MTPLDRDTTEQLIELIVPLVSSESARRALIVRAFMGTDIGGNVNFSGGGRDFAVNLIEQLVAYGNIDGVPALWRLLETIRDGGYYGTDRREKINKILASMQFSFSSNSTDEVQEQSDATSPIRAEDNPEWSEIQRQIALSRLNKNLTQLASSINKLPSNDPEVRMRQIGEDLSRLWAAFERNTEHSGWKVKEVINERQTKQEPNTSTLSDNPISESSPDAMPAISKKAWVLSILQSKLGLGLILIVVLMLFFLYALLNSTPPAIPNATLPSSTQTTTVVSSSVPIITTNVSPTLMATLEGFASTVPTASDTGEIVVFRDRTTLTIYIPGQTTLDLTRLAFEVVAVNQQRQRYTLMDFPLFSGYPFAAVPTPICFRLELTGSDAPIPLQCSGQDVVVQPLASADVFWYDDSANLERTIAVLWNGENVDFCPGSSSTCVVTLGG